MLKVKPFKQRQSHCGPAALKMVMDYFGARVSGDRIAKVARTTIASGTKAKNILRAARAFGFSGFIKERATIEDIKKFVLKKKIPVIVNWFSVDEGHYSVVVHVGRDSIYLQDPELGRKRVLGIQTFLRVWFTTRGVLRRKEQIVMRRMIAVFPQ